MDELTDLTEKMPESTTMALLQNAVKDIPQLSIVETLDEYTSTTSGAGSCTQLTYTSYYILLINACIRYDATNTSTPSKRRNVYTAAGAQDLNAIEEPHEAHFYHDIDTPSGDFYQVHQAKQGKPYLGFREITPESQPPLQPKNLSKNMMALYMSINLVHIHLLYHVAEAKQVQHGSLVDRGANGGLAGSDVRILSKSSR